MKEKITNFLKWFWDWFCIVWWIVVLILPFSIVRTLYKHNQTIEAENRVMEAHDELNKALAERLETLDSVIYFLTVEDEGKNK